MNVLRLRRMGMQAGRLLRAKAGRPAKQYLSQRVDEYRALWRAAAERCGADWSELDRDLWRVERDGVAVVVRRGDIQLDDPVILAMAGRKPLMHRLLRDAGLPVPEHAVFDLDTLATATDFLARHPRGVVVKPANDTAAGDGISTHLTTPRQVREAALLASLHGRELLVEEQVAGESYRILVVGGEIVHAVCRRGLRVRGDGRASVRALISGRDVERPVPNDADCRFTLGAQGLSLDSVPEEGRVVLVKAIAGERSGVRELRTVYDAVVTDSLGPSLRESAERAARVLGSDFVGVDVITLDPARPLAETGGCINEVNTTPALHHHYDADRAGASDPGIAAVVLQLALERRGLRDAPGGVPSRSTGP